MRAYLSIYIYTHRRIIDNNQHNVKRVVLRGDRRSVRAERETSARNQDKNPSVKSSRLKFKSGSQHYEHCGPNLRLNTQTCVKKTAVYPSRCRLGTDGGDAVSLWTVTRTVTGIRPSEGGGSATPKSYVRNHPPKSKPKQITHSSSFTCNIQDSFLHPSLHAQLHPSLRPATPLSPPSYTSPKISPETYLFIYY